MEKTLTGVDQIVLGELELYVHKRKQLTPELTGRETLNQAFNLADEKPADSAPVQ